jgi:hypothetical protein
MNNTKKEFYKIVRCSSFEELAEALNFFLSEGWFLEDQTTIRTEFFQEFVAVLVSKDYLKHQAKYYSLLEGKKQKPEFNLLLKNNEIFSLNKKQ